MVGPSSSHTAGAARLGNIARRICGKDFTRVAFYLHGSFASTYQGHGTDRALLGGILGLEPADERIRDSFTIARARGLEWEFIPADLGDVHPNTVRIEAWCQDGSLCTVQGASIGGGKVLITRINHLPVEFSCQYPTLITRHLDQPGVVARVTALLAQNDINIAFLKVFRESRGEEAAMIIETDQNITEAVLAGLRELPGIEETVFVNGAITPAEEGD